MRSLLFTPLRAVSALASAVLGTLVLGLASPLAAAQPAQTPAQQPAQQSAPTVPAPAQETVTKTQAAIPLSEWPAATRNRFNTLQVRLESQPDDLNAWLDIGQLRLEVGRLGEAKASFLEAIALDYLSADAHFGLGLTEYSSGNYRAALFEFGEVTRLFPERFDGHFNKAVTLAQLRRAEDAVTAFQEALLQAAPEAGRRARASAQLGLAGQLEALSRFDEAVDAYSAAINLSNRSSDLVLARSEALYKGGRGLEALPALTRLEADGDDYRASALIADIYLQAKQTDYALAALTRAQRRAAASGVPQVEADVLLQLGLLQRSLGRADAATRSFAAAAELTPDSSQALYTLGVSYLEGGQPQQALVPLQNALSLGSGRSPISGEIYLALATAFDQLGQLDAARRSAEAAGSRLGERRLKLDALAISGRSLYRSGNYRGALIALRDVAEARPNDAQAQLWVGLAYYQQGDYTEAAVRYERAATLDPDNADARLNLGAAYLAAERYSDAESVYALLTQQNAQDSEAFYNLGWSLFSQGRSDEAQSAWSQASELGYEPAQTALSEYFGTQAP